MLKFSENMKLKDFTYVSIGPNPYIEKEMDILSQKDIKGSEKEMVIHKGDFYMIYPIRK